MSGLELRAGPVGQGPRPACNVRQKITPGPLWNYAAALNVIPLCIPLVQARQHVARWNTS